MQGKVFKNTLLTVVALMGGALGYFGFFQLFYIYPIFCKENILVYIFIIYNMTYKQFLLCLEQQGNLTVYAYHRLQVSDFNKEFCMNFRANRDSFPNSVWHQQPYRSWVYGKELTNHKFSWQVLQCQQIYCNQLGRRRKKNLLGKKQSSAKIS